MKTIGLIVCTFLIGFFAHAFFFPDFMYNGIQQTAQTFKPQTSITPVQDGPETSLYKYVKFDGSQFSPKNITIEKGMYLVILNESETQFMWLVSDNKDLATVRNYGHLEQIKKRLDTIGTFHVFDKAHPQSQLVVIVKP